MMIFHSYVSLPEGNLSLSSFHHHCKRHLGGDARGGPVREAGIATARAQGVDGLGDLPGVRTARHGEIPWENPGKSEKNGIWN